jgi:hypothetical protein
LAARLYARAKASKLGEKLAPVLVRADAKWMTEATFLPVFDDEGNEWLQAASVGRFDRIALVGADHFFGLSGEHCTDLGRVRHTRQQIIRTGEPARAASIARCGAANQQFIAMRNRRKPNEPRAQDDRKAHRYAEVARIQNDIRALTGAEARGQTLLDLRVERARAATAKCVENIGRVRTSLGKDKDAALSSDMSLYKRRAAIAESLLAAIERHQEEGWAAILQSILSVPAAFGGRAEPELAAVAEATAVFAAVRGLHDPAVASEHAALMGALGQTRARRIVRKAVLQTLPFGRALVAAVGAACSRPSFGRSYV